MSETNLRYQPIEINLLHEPGKQQSSTPLIVLLVVVAVLSFSAPTLLLSSSLVAIKETSQEIERIDGQIAELEAQAQAQARPANPEQIIQAIGHLQEYRPSAKAILEQLNGMLLQETNVRTVSFSGGKTVEITLQFASAEHVVTFLNEIEKSEYFELIAMSPMTNDKIKRDELLRRDNVATETGIPGTVERDAESDSGEEETIYPATVVSFELEYVPSSANGTGGSS